MPGPGRAAVDKFGKLDIAFNNAGVLGEMGASTGISEAGWSRHSPPTSPRRSSAPSTRSRRCRRLAAARSIFTSTFVGHSLGFPGMAAYAASKSGLIGLTQVLAAEYGPQNIRVNADAARRRRHADVSQERHETPESKDFVNNCTR
jgi:NAD(P)-dependent dehydrogenase (short-subunit alcohol dehydrogenase family)